MKTGATYLLLIIFLVLSGQIRAHSASPTPFNSLQSAATSYPEHDAMLKGNENWDILDGTVILSCEEDEFSSIKKKIVIAQIVTAINTFLYPYDHLNFAKPTAEFPYTSSSSRKYIFLRVIRI